MTLPDTTPCHHHVTGCGVRPAPHLSMKLGTLLTELATPLVLLLRRVFTWSSDGRALAALSSWATGEPNNALSGEDCVEVTNVEHPNARINDKRCGDTSAFLCQFNFECPQGEYASDSSTCTLCPAGTFQDGTDGSGGRFSCRPCPQGRYGSLTGETRGTCEGPCAAGYSCPPGSVDPITPYGTVAPEACPSGAITSEFCLACAPVSVPGTRISTPQPHSDVSPTLARRF